MSKNILVVIDIQQEYTTPGRPFYLHGFEDSLEHCRQLLSFAREHAWQIIHVQHSNGESAERFNPKMPFFDFVEGFQPMQGEKHDVKNDFSCYSGEVFANAMESIDQMDQASNVYLIGYNTIMCCLSTLEEARRKGHKMHLVTDATYAKAIAGVDEMSMHNIMLAIFKQKNLATLVTTADVLKK